MKSVPLKLSALIVLGFLCLSCGRKAPPRLPVHEAPSVPSRLSAVQRYHPRQVVLLWKDGARGGLFVVERTSGGEFVQIATVAEQHFIDGGLDEGMTYRYRVRGMSEEGVTGDAAATGDVKPVPGLAEPSDVSFDISGDTVKLGWSYPGDVSGLKFNIYRRTEGGEYPLSPANGEPVSGNMFEDEQDFERAVYYEVRRLVPGEVPTEGPPSAEVSVAPRDYVPRQVAGVGFAVTAEKVLVLWDENPEPWIRGYRVYRAEEGGGFRAIGTSRTPAFEDDEPLPGQGSYRVSALGPVSEGPPSETVVVPPAGQP